MSQQFYKTELERELLIAKIKKHPSLYEVFRKKKDLTPQTNEDVQVRINGEIENFVTIFVCGSQGSFKSSVAQEIASKNDPTFTAYRICFTYQEFKDKLEKSNPREWFILDEQVFQHGTGSTRIIESIQTLIETLRQRQNSLIVISPEKKYFPEGIFTYTIETLDRSILGKCTNNDKLHEIRICLFRPHRDIEATIRCVIRKDNEYIAFYIMKITWNTQLWREYYIRKVAFNKIILTEDFQKIDYQKIATEIIEDEEAKVYQTKKQLMLYLEKKYPNYAVGEKELIIAQIQLLRNNIKTKDIEETKQQLKKIWESEPTHSTNGDWQEE
jgi:hypothetical protein